MITSRRATAHLDARKGSGRRRSRLGVLGLAAMVVAGSLTTVLATSTPAGAATTTGSAVPAGGFDGTAPKNKVSGFALGGPSDGGGLYLYGHTCAITGEATPVVKCWGHSEWGQLGNGTTYDSGFNFPVLVPLSTEAGTNPVPRKSQANGPTIASSLGGSCVIFDSDLITGGVQCWGAGNGGQIGDGRPATSGSGGTYGEKDRPYVVKAPGGSGFLTDVVTLAGGGYDQQTYNANCAIRSDGIPYCWGYDNSGETGAGATGNKVYPTRLGSIGTPTSPQVSMDGSSDDKKAATISEGSDHGCLSTVSKKAYCWGTDDYSALGHGSPAQSNFPTPVLTAAGTNLGSDVISVSVGDDFSCALYGQATTNRTVWCWGQNASRQTGQATGSTTPYAKEVTALKYGSATLPPGGYVTSIATGGQHACAVISDGTVQCWGTGAGSARGATGNSAVPAAVGGATGVKTSLSGAISAGVQSTCVSLASDDSLKCWGYSDTTTATFGDGTYSSNYTKVFVTCSPLTVAAGTNSTCTAQVAAKGSPVTGSPTGTITFSTVSGTGSPVWTPSPTCALTAVSVGLSSCSVSVNVSATAIVVGTYSASGGSWIGGNSRNWTQDNPTVATNAASGSDNLYSNDTDTQATLTVAPSTTTGVVCSPNPQIVGSSTTCTATVTRTSGSGTPLGTVHFTKTAIGSGQPTFVGSSSCTLPSPGSGSSGSCTVTLTSSQVGSSTVGASFVPTSSHAASSGTTTMTWTPPPLKPTSTALSCGSSGLAFDSTATCTVTVTDTSASPVTPTSTVTLSAAGSPGTATFSPCTLTPVSTGVASCTVTLTVSSQDSYSITASAAANATHAASTSSPVTLKFGAHTTTTVVACTPTAVVAGNPTTCTATVTDVHAGVTNTSPSGTVLWGQSGGGSFSSPTCALAPGASPSSTCSVTFTPTFGGAKTVVASFDGLTSGAVADGYRHRSSAAVPVPLTVSGSSAQHPTATTLSCSPSTVQVLVATTCTATVTDTMTLAATSTPTGTVTFGSSGGGTLSSPTCTLTVLVAGQSASCTVSFTPNATAGAKTVSASYGGVPVQFKASGSGSVYVTATAAPVTSPPAQVQHPTTTSTSCSPVTVPLGDASTCTFTVVDTYVGTTSSPAGTVSVRTSGGGTLSTTTCTLVAAGDDQTSTCQVTFTPTGAKGSKTVSGSYAGTPLVHKASGSGSFFVTAT